MVTLQQGVAAATGQVTPTSDNAPWQARVEGNRIADSGDCAANQIVIDAKMGPIGQVLARLDGFKARNNGHNRWRACCPAHGGTNPSALSVGLGENGAVLLRCWSGCSLEAITDALGLRVKDLFPPRESHTRATKRRHLLTAEQALDVLKDEAEFVGVAAANVAYGLELSTEDKDRLLLAAARIAALHGEARS